MHIRKPIMRLALRECDFKLYEQIIEIMRRSKMNDTETEKHRKNKAVRTRKTQNISLITLKPKK